MQSAANHRRPSRHHGELGQTGPAAKNDQGCDNRRVPDHRRGVRKKKFAVAVQDSQAPRGEHQQANSREKNADQLDGKPARLAVEAGRDHRDEPGCGQHAHQYQDGGDQRQDGKHGACHPSGLIFLALRHQLGVHRNERGGEHALAEQVLQDIGDAYRGAERVRNIRNSEEVGQSPAANQSGDAAQENGRRN